MPQMYIDRNECHILREGESSSEYKIEKRIKQKNQVLNSIALAKSNSSNSLRLMT